MISAAAFFLACFAAASTGAIFKPGAWYAGLAKPGWTPPNWAFPVVWTALYLMIAAAGWLVWQAAGAAATAFLVVYALNLAVNAAWSWLFFGLRRMDWALADAAGLWLSAAALPLLALPHSALAAGLLAPYAAWVTVATALNLRLLQMNRPASA